MTDDLERLHRASRWIRARAKAAKGLPAVLFLTDPQRTPHPERDAEGLPCGSAVVFRAFGAPDAVAQGWRLRAVTRRRGLVLLVGADPGLARAIGADGVHLPERLAHRAGALRRSRPGWIVTAAAHDEAAVRRARRAGAQAVLVSPVFESASASAGRPMGVLRFAALVRRAGLPVYALGGIDAGTAQRLTSTGAAGVAAVSALIRSEVRT